ncbi:GTP-binding protein [Zhengella mangrovi]|uniref:GTP-binding protein n=1 Tax=Zhengella mangrovi TaxID=1982044 RepID=A0A2G1QJ88_9HYPH|nr:GTP-binding protein [Zhengella mangrovi]PHP65520.1 GTP-binding protein [Zhengella mangrovi]
MHDQIPVTVVTGFLGSGKTTLLNRLLKDPALTDTAVIVNEFGEVGIDHLLVEQSADGVIELSDGCLCCTVRSDLVLTLADLVDRVQSGRIASLKRIVIETTGLADPAPVLQAVIGHPALQWALRLDGVVTTVDAVNGMRTLDNHEEAVKQAAVAERIVLTKTDLADGDTVAALKGRLAALNPQAQILDAQDEPSVAALMDCGAWNPDTKSADVRKWLAAEAGGDQGRDHHHGGHDHGHGHGDDHHHHHDVNRHDARIRSFSIVHDKPVDKLAVAMFLDLLASGHGDKLLRMKGIVELKDDPERPLVIHGVQSVMHPPVRLDAWPKGPRGTRIVLITQDLGEDFVRRMFAAFTDTPAIDTPDRQAVTENPLAVPGFRR